MTRLASVKVGSAWIHSLFGVLLRCFSESFQRKRVTNRLASVDHSCVWGLHFSGLFASGI